MKQIKVIRTATVALSLDVLLQGQLAYLDQYYDMVAVSGMDAHLQHVATREGVTIRSVAMERKIAPIKDLVSLVRLIQLFRKEKPTIVHSITPKAGLLSMVAAKIAGVPIRIHTFTGLIFPSKTGMLQKLLIGMDRILCAAATHIIPEGRGVANDLTKYKITSKPLNILANGNVNGIDIDYYNTTSDVSNQMSVIINKLGIDETDYKFCFVGRLVRDKGIQELVQAFVQLQQESEAVSLLLVGPFESELDPLDATTLHTIEQHPKIFTVGFQKDIRPYIAMSDAFVFPSYREGFPNVVLQAGAFGKPSIVTNINGSNEIIVDGMNGHIIPSKSFTHLFEKMKQYVQHKYAFDAARIRQHIVSHYSNATVWEAVHEFYKKCLS